MNKVKLIICATLGNCLEIYDFLIYQLLATRISIYFSDKNSLHAMAWAQIIFTLTVIISRPLGGIIFGYISDMYGRKISLEKSVLLSGMATGMIGLIPDYQYCGILSTLMLILLRLLQGISLGGEHGTSLAFLLEHASPKNKGFLASFCCFGQLSGILLAIVAATYYNQMFPDDCSSQAWRFLFAMSFIGGILGYWIRKKTNETIDFLLSNYCAPEGSPTLISHARQFLYSNRSRVLAAFSMVSFGGFITYSIFIVGNKYPTDYSTTLPNLKNIQYIMSVSSILSVPIFGYLSDKFGRKPLLICSLTAICLLSVQFFCSTHSSQCINNLLVPTLLAISCSGYFAVAPTMIMESTSGKSRCLNFAIMYTTPAAIIAGTTPYLTDRVVSFDSSYVALAILILGICAGIGINALPEPTRIYRRLHKYSYEFLKP